MCLRQELMTSATWFAHKIQIEGLRINRGCVYTFCLAILIICISCLEGMYACWVHDRSIE